jgi:hypothetical protein
MEHNEKVQVLLSLLNIRQDNLRVMRERVFTIVSTTISLFVIFVGWMVQKPSAPSLIETIFLVFIMMVFWIGNLLILWDIRKGFINTHKMLVRIEQCLELYKPNVFTEDGKSLFPEDMQTPIQAVHFQRFEYILSFTAIISIIILIMKYFFN